MRVQNIVLIAACLALLLSGCAGGGQDRETLRNIPREDRVALMVLNFSNASVGGALTEYKPWEFGIPSMLITDLESIGLFNILSWERLTDIMEQQKFQNLGLVDESKAVEMGKIAAARYTLTGTFMVMNGTLRMEAKVYSVEEGTLLGASSVTGEVKRFFELEKKLLVEMTAYLGAMLSPAEMDRIEGMVETTSVEASLINYSGEMDVLRAGNMETEGKGGLASDLISTAKAKFKAALRHDPSFVRAQKNLESLAMAMPMTL